MLSRVSWAAVAALAFIILAMVCAAVQQEVFAVVFAICSTTWAILSLKDQT